MDIIENLLVVIAIGVMLFYMKDIWKSSREIKRFSKIGRDMSKYRWLMKAGMQEQAKYFNAFGLRSKKHNPFMWY
ncbi:hypothetical protein LCGC14_2324240 [marine sediment metagenome]|uniref:Uncharacterized protein n=1 Tax=marine sediment metagenome TaxID=412755 RepID=A0A0F9D4G5_9ZZZZ